MSARAEFEELLKTSEHFADVMNTHRQAPGQILAVFLAVLVKEHDIPAERVLEILKTADKIADGPSLRTERRHLISVVRETMQRLP